MVLLLLFLLAVPLVSPLFCMNRTKPQGRRVLGAGQEEPPMPSEGTERDVPGRVGRSFAAARLFLNFLIACMHTTGDQRSPFRCSTNVWLCDAIPLA